MEQLLEYIVELKTQIVFVIDREIEALHLSDVKKFHELQKIEGELLVLLNNVKLQVKSSGVVSGSYELMEKLSNACIGFRKGLEAKHSAMKSFYTLNGESTFEGYTLKVGNSSEIYH